MAQTANKQGAYQEDIVEVLSVKMITRLITKSIFDLGIQPEYVPLLMQESENTSGKSWRQIDCGKYTAIAEQGTFSMKETWRQSAHVSRG